MTPSFKLGNFVAASFAVARCLLRGVDVSAQTEAQRKSVAASTSVAAPPAPRMPAVGGTTIDRVVAIVNGDLILDSDVNEEQRFETLQPFGIVSGKAATPYGRVIERLIDRELILQQSKLQPEDAISDSDVDKDLAGLKRNLPECREFHCDTDEGWTRFLATHGFTPELMKERWKQRMEV